MSIKNASCVFVGGGLGAFLRYTIQHHLQWKAEPMFPWGTLSVNVSGAFLIGLLMEAFMEHFKGNPEWRLFLIVGVLGGYTTFSSLVWEGYELFSAGHLMQGASYILASALGGAVAVLAGLYVGRFV